MGFFNSMARVASSTIILAGGGIVSSGGNVESLGAYDIAFEMFAFIYFLGAAPLCMLKRETIMQPLADTMNTPCGGADNVSTGVGNSRPDEERNSGPV